MFGSPLGKLFQLQLIENPSEIFQKINQLINQFY